MPISGEKFSERKSTCRTPGAEQDDIAFAQLNHHQATCDKSSHEDVAEFRVLGHEQQHFFTREFKDSTIFCHSRRKERSTAGDYRHFSCELSWFANCQDLLILTGPADRDCPVQDDKQRNIGTRGFIENLPTMHGTELRHRTNPVNVFSSKCRIVLHPANTSFPLTGQPDYTAMLSRLCSQRNYMFL
jgi:hypothetical protein